MYFAFSASAGALQVFDLTARDSRRTFFGAALLCDATLLALRTLAPADADVRIMRGATLVTQLMFVIASMLNAAKLQRCRVGNVSTQAARLARLQRDARATFVAAALVAVLLIVGERWSSLVLLSTYASSSSSWMPLDARPVAMTLLQFLALMQYCVFK